MQSPAAKDPQAADTSTKTAGYPIIPENQELQDKTTVQDSNLDELLIDSGGDLEEVWPGTYRSRLPDLRDEEIQSRFICSELLDPVVMLVLLFKMKQWTNIR